MSLPSTVLPLDENLYALEADELAYFKSQTGIGDEVELKKHILAVQKMAYKVFPYPCIRLFEFIKLRIFRTPFYARALQLSRERKGAILVDAGCNLGHDLRKVIADGWPIENVVAFDLHSAFWDYGHELFRTTPETFPAAFLAADVFDPLMIAPRAPLDEEPDTPAPNLRSLTSLTPLQGRASVIHASAFFHLFDEEQQLRAARQLASLLSPAPGSMIFGVHGGFHAKGSIVHHLSGRPSTMFCNSPESWKALWDGQVFPNATVRVEVELKESKKFGDVTRGERFFFLRVHNKFTITSTPEDPRSEPAPFQDCVCQFASPL